MSPPKPPKLDLIPGTEYDWIIVAGLLIGLLYVGTGGWSEKRWMQFGALAVPTLAHAVGYNTFNPKLHQPRRDSRGRFVSRSEERLD